MCARWFQGPHRDRLEGRDAHDRERAPEAEALQRRETDAQAGERSRAGGDRHRVDCGEVDPAGAERLVDDGEQARRVLTRGALLARRDDPLPLEYGDGQSLGRSLDREQPARAPRGSVARSRRGIAHEAPFESQSTKRSQNGVRSFQNARPMSSTMTANPTDVAISRVRAESGERLMPSIE